MEESEMEDSLLLLKAKAPVPAPAASSQFLSVNSNYNINNENVSILTTAQPPDKVKKFLSGSAGFLSVNCKTRSKLRSADSKEDRPSPTIDVPATSVNPSEQSAQAKRVAPHMAEKILHVKAIREDLSKNTGVAAPSANRDTKSVPANEGIEGNQVFIQQNKMVRPNLMERNGNSQASARPHHLCTNKGKGILRVNSQTGCELGPSHRFYKGPVIIADSEEYQPSCSKYGSLSPPEFNTLQDALEPSTSDLLAAVTEWEDSIDVSLEGKSSCSNRCRLPSPNIKHVSPLKEVVTYKWARKRRVNRWTVEEEKALIEGMEKYEKSWTLILKSNPKAFRNRTSVDLKDKWRNMCGRRK